VGQDEDSQSLVRRADFCRREQARRRRVAHIRKLSKHGFQPEGEVTGDVFKKDPFGAALGDDPGDLGPEVAGVVGTAAFASRAEGLAGVSGEDDVEGPTKGSSIETAQVVPVWGLGEISSALGGDADRTWPVLPLDKGAGVITGLGEYDAQIKASAACAEGQSVSGT
jgi:hypothetical protein